MTEEKSKADTMRWDEHLRAGMKGLRDEMREEIQSRAALSEFRKHRRAAMKEALMAWRSLIDGAIARIDEAEKSGGKRVTKIKIE
jgi:hypothetical protein